MLPHIRLLVGLGCAGLIVLGGLLVAGLGRPAEAVPMFCLSTGSKPGSGCLFAPGPEKRAFPLERTEVFARISGNLARVEVRQKFTNPYKNALEAVYVFPLPDEAAVDEMEIQLGDRVIKGSIRKREEARRIYRQAREQGRTAGLLEQERDNIFTQSLANIRPGEKIDVVIRYTESLKFNRGDYEFVFPMVVGPRYLPRQSTAALGQPFNYAREDDRLNPRYLPPGSRSGQDISLRVELDAGIPLQQVYSTSHRIRVNKLSSQTVAAQIAPSDTIPNKDFILRYRVAAEATRPAVLSQVDDRGGHFALYLIPAVAYQQQQVIPREVIFLMDTSGSQAGDPLAKSQALMRRFINGLGPADSFNIINFADSTESLAWKPIPNTAENRKLALSYIDRFTADGGTELIRGLKAVLQMPPPPKNRLRSVVLMTDGLIGNDPEAIALVKRELAPNVRLYSFGVGSSVNRYLINRIAEVGRGMSRVVRQDEPTEMVAQQFFERLDKPVLTDLSLNWEGPGTAPEIYPSALPDLFAGEPLVVFGRKKDARPGKLWLTGIQANGQRYTTTLPVKFAANSNPAIAQLWGRARLKDLSLQMLSTQTAESIEAATGTALTYRLLSDYTAFVAVTEEVRVDPRGKRLRVEVPAETPEGLDYEKSGAAARSTPKVKASRKILASQAAPAPGVVRANPSRGSIGIGYGTEKGEDKGSTTPVGIDDGVQIASPRRRQQELQSAGTRYTIGKGAIEDVQSRPVGDPSQAELLEEQEASGSGRSSMILAVTAPELSEPARRSLEAHLKQLQLPQPLSGPLTLQLRIVQGRIVEAVQLDRTFVAPEVLAALRGHLATWIGPRSLSRSLRVTLSPKR